MKGIIKFLVTSALIVAVAAVPVMADVASDITAAETRHNNHLAKVQAEQTAWENTLAGYLKRVEIDQKNYNISFLNEIYKGTLENKRIRDQLIGDTKTLASYNPAFASAVEAAQAAADCAAKDVENAKAALDAAKAQ